MKKLRLFSMGIVLMSMTSLVGCSMEANIESLTDQISELFDRKEPDFIPGEVVTTQNGYVVRAVFGEISEETESLNGNGWKVEGVFYQ